MSLEIILKKMGERKLVYGIIGLLLISSLGVVAGFKRVDETEFALEKDLWTGEVNFEHVYDSGRYYIGITHTFVKFPSTQISVDFSAGESENDVEVKDQPIRGRTQDGLALSLDVSFQYKLIKDQIPDLYREYANTYEGVFLKIARDVIRDVSSTYTAIEFFANRTLIGQSMLEEIRVGLAAAFADVPFLQLRDVDLPDEFENSLERKEVARQEIEIARLEQESALIRAETKILEAEAQRNITLIEANATAEAYLIQTEAQAKAINITLNAQRMAYYGLAQTLNLTSAELLSFLWIQALRDAAEFGNMIIITDGTPDLLLDTNSTTY